MRLVDRPAFKPGHCAAIPFKGQSAAGDRWIDTGAEMPGFDNHVYLSETAVREAAALLGFPTPEQYGALAAELATAYADLQAALDEQAALSRYKDAIDEIRRTPATA